MDLSRRDALAALAAGGVSVGAGATLLASGPGDGNGGDAGAGTATPGDAGAVPGLGAHERETLVAVARVVYPSAVTGVEAFVTTYLDGRAADREAYAAGVSAAVEQLDDRSESWYGGRVVDLDPGARERLLREVGADTAEPAPDGTPAERVRYYVVNELLFALYASPAGGELVGVENPIGHPGGTGSYQRGPN